MKMPTTDPCERASDELTPAHLRQLVRELSTTATRLRRGLLSGLERGTEPMALADVAMTATLQLSLCLDELGDEMAPEAVA
jgi:hypothetical protein